MKKLLMLFVVFVLSACSSAAPSANPSSAVESTQSAYPAPGMVEIPTPTVDPSLGQLRGRIMLKGQPFTTGVIYLAELIKDNEGNDIVARFARESPLRTIADKEGNFKFFNVPPGRYGVVYDDISTTVLLMAPDRDESLIVTINAGEEQDLGVLNYVALPSSE